MMLGLLACILVLLIPVYCQFKYGINAASGWINLKLWQLTLICLLSELLIGFLMFFTLMFLDSNAEDTFKCGFWLSGVSLFAFPISFFIVLVGIFQRIIIRKDE